MYRTMIYIPGNDPSMIQDSDIYGADGIILDLEDSVSTSEKDAARDLVKNALSELKFKENTVGVRINSLKTNYWEKDIEEIIPAKPFFIRIPKIENSCEIIKVDKILSKIESQNKLEIGSIRLIPMLETAIGIMNALDIANSSDRILGLSLGGEDLLADIGMKRTESGNVFDFIRAKVSLSASAAGVEAFDTIYPNINDLDGLKRETEYIKNLGFTGKSVIHPDQIKVIHKIFTPTQEEIEEAKQIILAAKKAEINSKGVSSINGKMIDKPVIKQAKITLERAGIKEENYAT